MNNDTARKRFPRYLVTTIIVVGVVIISILTLINPSETKGEFSANPIEHDNISFILESSDYDVDAYVFKFIVVNNGNSPVTIGTNDFVLVNGDKRYESDDFAHDFAELNPGTSDMITVEFIANADDITEGSPFIEIDRGFFFKDAVEMSLVKE